jgi:hypothetical protein
MFGALVRLGEGDTVVTVGGLGRVAVAGGVTAAVGDA